MPRIRTLKPEHRQHRKIGPLDHLTYRLWVGMILEADDAGRLVCDAEHLRVTIFGYHPKVTAAVLEASLATLNRAGLIRLYAEGATRYACFPSWPDHQVINRPKPSILPECKGSLNDHGTISDPSLNDHGGREGNGKGRKGTERSTALAVMSDGQFIESLKGNPAYQGIDIDRELGRMDAWLSTPKGKGRKKTRQFVVAWLNRIDRPMDSAERPIVPGEAVFRRFVERHGGEA